MHENQSYRMNQTRMQLRVQSPIETDLTMPSEFGPPIWNSFLYLRLRWERVKTPPAELATLLVMDDSGMPLLITEADPPLPTNTIDFWLPLEIMISSLQSESGGDAVQEELELIPEEEAWISLTLVGLWDETSGRFDGRELSEMGRRFSVEMAVSKLCLLPERTDG